MTQTEAIRAALDELGNEATTDELKVWAKANGVTLTNSFDSIVSHEKRKRRKSGNLTEQGERDNWVAMMRAVRKLTDKWGAAGLLELSADLELVLTTVGDWDAFREMVTLMTPPGAEAGIEAGNKSAERQSANAPG